VLERLAGVNYIALDKVNLMFMDWYLFLSPSYRITNIYIYMYVYMYVHCVYVSVIGSGYIGTNVS